MVDTTIFSTFIYSISVTFANVITSDRPIIIDNDDFYDDLIFIMMIDNKDNF